MANCYNLVSLFAGAGGLDIGFESTGSFRTVLAVDLAEYNIRTLERNRTLGHEIATLALTPWFERLLGVPERVQLLAEATILRADLAEARGNDLRLLMPSRIDIVVGGPPCQPFSVRNRRADKGLQDKDGRGNLVFSYMELVGDLKPSVFLFENVAGLGRPDNVEVLESLLHFGREKLGYRVTVSKIYASDYGVPQARHRFIIVGTQSGINYIPPTPTHGERTLFDETQLQPLVTVRDVLSDLPEAGSAGGPSNHSAPKHTDEVVGKADTVRKKIRLHPDRPCPALFSGSDTGGGLSDIHPWLDRALTPRECARLQGFPDFWEFASPRSGQVHKMIANAVPPRLAAAFAYRIAIALDEYYGTNSFETTGGPQKQ
jgi:DNA (cytosine-5)-methyltransferase 1